MTIQQIMTATPTFCTVNELTTDAALRMKTADVGFLPVVQDAESRTLAGVITDRDLCMRAYPPTKDGRPIVVKDCMTTHPVSCKPTDDVESALGLMDSHLIRRLPVVDSQTNRLLGVITLGDIARSSVAGAHDVSRVYVDVSRPSMATRPIAA